MFQPELSSKAASKSLQGNTVLHRQEPVASVNSNIFEDCFFFKLTVHTIGTRRKVSADSIEVAADKSLLHISKEILESEELDKIRAADRTLRAYLTWKCVPLAFFRSGIYAVSSETLDEVDQEIEKYRDVRADVLVPHFLSAYSQMKCDAEERLGILYDPADYPDEAEVSASFFVEVEYIQMGVPRKLATVSEAIYRRESQNAKRMIQEVTDEIQRVLATQMSELVSHMVERLTPEADGTTKVSIITTALAPFDDGITPRFLAASAIIAIWGAYESSIHYIAKSEALHQNVSLKISDLRGDFLQRSRVYFKKVLGFDLHTNDTEYQKLKDLYALRNALAHANGRLSDVHNDGELRKWIASRNDIKIVDDEYVIVTFDFVNDAFDFIEKLIGDLTKRAPML